MQMAQNLPPHLQNEFVQIIEEMQVRDSVSVYNRIVEHCFRDCVSTFQGKSLEFQEKKCIDNCADKFLNMSKRVGNRFAEHNQKMQADAMNQFNTQGPGAQ